VRVSLVLAWALRVHSLLVSLNVRVVEYLVVNGVLKIKYVVLSLAWSAWSCLLP